MRAGAERTGSIQLGLRIDLRVPLPPSPDPLVALHPPRFAPPPFPPSSLVAPPPSIPRFPDPQLIRSFSPGEPYI